MPWQYVGKKVRVIATAQRIHIIDPLSLERIALHSTSQKIGERNTDELHWPQEKREHCDFNLERAKQDAHKIGLKTFEFLTKIKYAN